MASCGAQRWALETRHVYYESLRGFYRWLARGEWIYLFATISKCVYHGGMGTEWTVIISREVREWFDQQTQADQIVVRRAVARLRMPHSRPLGDGLHELRFSIKDGRVDQRITYIFDVERHVITLTTFPKTRNNERRQVRRARDAQAAYKHGRK